MNDIFSIFNPDWWMDENNNALQMTDAVLFLLLAIPVAYLFIYALASLRKYKNPYPPSPKRHRFLVLFVVLKNGKEVIESINHFLDTQTYPREKYDIAVAATQLSEEDLVTLLQMPVNIVVPDKEHCTKIYAIQQVMERYSPHEYDAITIFNSDNKVVPNALELFNNAYYSGCDAIQAHRMTENL
ncbi:glycosyltransferase, partial [Bacteroides uniformis]